MAAIFLFLQSEFEILRLKSAACKVSFWYPMEIPLAVPCTLFCCPERLVYLFWWNRITQGFTECKCKVTQRRLGGASRRNCKHRLTGRPRFAATDGMAKPPCLSAGNAGFDEHTGINYGLDKWSLICRLVVRSAESDRYGHGKRHSTGNMNFISSLKCGKRLTPQT